MLYNKNLKNIFPKCPNSYELLQILKKNNPDWKNNLKTLKKIYDCIDTDVNSTVFYEIQEYLEIVNCLLKQDEIEKRDMFRN
jgi:hypothetical protein